MVENKLGVDGRKRSWADQYDDIKVVLDSIAYEIVKRADDADFYDTVNFKKVLVKADANYTTFINHNGYVRLEEYNGVRNVENKKEIEFNPYRWLRARRLGPDNEHYIEEVYD
jgi:hypothetical protein